MPRIKFLESTLGNSIGETVRVVEETENEVYYFDGLRRYCYFLKSEEGTAYLYILDRKRKPREVPCHAKL